MKKYLLLFVVGIVFVSGCGLLGSAGPTKLNELKATDAKQKSVQFYVGIGYLGGPGGAPVIDKETGSIVSLRNDLPVYFDADEVGELKKLLPACYTGKPILRVIADVSLNKKSFTNESLPEPELQWYDEIKVLKYLEPTEVSGVELCE